MAANVVVSDGRMGLQVDRWLDPFVRPDAYFERRVPIRDLGPAKALLAVALAFVGPYVWFEAGLGSATPRPTFWNVAETTATAIVAATSVILLAWLAGSVVVCTAAWLVGGTFDLTETGSVVAYATVPFAVELLAVAALSGLSNGAETVGGLAVVTTRLGATSSPYGALSVVTACWQGYVLTFGLKHANDLPTWRAAAVAAVFVLPTVAEVLA